ncbi:hypothetical protein ACQB60_09680 [Actinomycetota bacterium Odt1-20B]
MATVVETITADEVAETVAVESNIEGGDFAAVDWESLGIDPEGGEFDRPVVLCNSAT